MPKLSDLTGTEIAELLGSPAPDRQEFPLPWSYENGMLRDATGWMIAAPWKAAGTLIVHAVNTLEERERLLEEAASIVKDFADSECDYMRINHLGDGEQQHNVKRARAFLAKLEARDA